MNSYLLIRVLRGEESLGRTFWITLLLLAVFAAYEHVIPLLSNALVDVHRSFRIFLLTYTLAAIHNACPQYGSFARMLARTYVVLLVMLAAYFMYRYFGPPWALAYPLMAMVFTFLVKE